MMRLQRWQWAVLALPIVAIASFLLFAAGRQIHAWGLNWIWAVVTLALVGWRWLLVRWTQPLLQEMEAVVADVQKDLEASTETDQSLTSSTAQPIHVIVTEAIQASQGDRPVWEDWPTFWQRCQDLVVAIAHVYHPSVKYPLLNIYIPQAYGLIRGTVDDMDTWMQKLSPVLNQVTVGQAVQAYDMYRKLEPSARKFLRVWNWAQWLWNPAAAVARQATQRSSDQATQQLLMNLSQVLREAALRNLAQQAIALYSGSSLPFSEPIAPPTLALPTAKTQTLREILAQATPVESVEQQPVTLMLAGRTGAGKSSLINTLFRADKAAVNVLPTTVEIQDYTWQTEDGNRLILLDTPGYEQANRADFRELVLDRAAEADMVLVVTPALDPALQMDVDFLKDLQQAVPDLPAIVAVTQVDRLRPLREWNPPYDWQWGDRPKEVSIREATQYRAEQLGDYCDRIIPIVSADLQANRDAWGADTLSLAMMEAIAPAKQLRMARFLKNLDARTVAAAQIIDQYTFQMSTSHGLTALLKRPVLQFVSTLTTGAPDLAYVLAETIPVEQVPVVIGKLQMAYELSIVLNPERPLAADLLSLWPLLRDNPAPPQRNAWAFGHALVEYWTQNLTLDQMQQRFNYYWQNAR
ncbi:GTPase family protein [Leptolyngbya sp. AN02str]|uniref:GTPase family protein n=1 Tax=Leptolyngbya sp. AN02str TaxID=3423363 RepID=UPI003D31A5E7